MNERKTATLYALNHGGQLQRVARYDRQKAIEAVNDVTIARILHARELGAIDDENGALIASRKYK